MAEDTASETTDPFVLARIYPDAEGALLFQSVDVGLASKDCLVVLDANALLLPYEIGPTSLIDVERVLTELARAGRLFVPEQALREFLKHRPRKLAAIWKSILSLESRAGNVDLPKSISLEGTDEFDRVVRARSDLNRAAEIYREALKDLRGRIESWGWNDPVCAVYSKIVKGQVIRKLTLDEAARKAIETDQKWREANAVPPGYKDTAPGDLIIWKTILELAAEKKAHVLFVSRDEKADWRVREEKQAVFLRFELVDEFRRASAGKSIHAVNFEQFARLFAKEISEATLREIRDAETAMRALYEVEDSPTVWRSRSSLTTISQSVWFWWLKRLGAEYGAPSTQLGPITIVETHGVRRGFTSISPPELVTLLEGERLRELDTAVNAALDTGRAREVLVAFLEYGAGAARQLKRVFGAKLQEALPRAAVVFLGVDDGYGGASTIPQEV